MAEKIAWSLFGIAVVCTVIAAVTSPLRIAAASVCFAAVAIVLSLFGLYFAFVSWHEK